MTDEAIETFTKEQVAELIAEQVNGLKANNSALLAEKKRLADVAKKYEGLDPDVARQAIADQQDAARTADVQRQEADYTALSTAGLPEDLARRLSGWSVGG